MDGIPPIEVTRHGSTRKESRNTAAEVALQSLPKLTYIEQLQHILNPPDLRWVRAVHLCDLHIVQ